MGVPARGATSPEVATARVVAPAVEPFSVRAPTTRTANVPTAISGLEGSASVGDTLTFTVTGDLTIAGRGRARPST